MEVTFSSLKLSTLWWEVESWGIDVDYGTPPELDSHCIAKGSGPLRAVIQHKYLHCVDYKALGDARSFSGYVMPFESCSPMWVAI